MEEKERIEREALAFFLRIYNRKYNTKYRLFSKRERPDFTVKDRITKRVMGVEIAHIFHDKKEAMMFLGRDDSQIHGIITAQDHVDVLMRVLRKKAEKVQGYDFKGPVVLVLRDFSQLFDVHSIFDARYGLKVPSSGYKEVWYLGRSRPVRKWDELVRIK